MQFAATTGEHTPPAEAGMASPYRDAVSMWQERRLRALPVPRPVRSQGVDDLAQTCRQALVTHRVDRAFIHIKQRTVFCVILQHHPSAKNEAAHKCKRDEEGKEQSSLGAGREQSRRKQHLVVVAADLDGQESARMGGVDEVLQNNVCKCNSVGLVCILCQGVATEEQRGSCHGPGHASTRLTGHTADPC